MKEMWRLCQQLWCLGWVSPKLLLYMAFALCEWRGEGLWGQVYMPAEPLKWAVLLPRLAPIAFSLLSALVYWQETMIYTFYGFHILERKTLIKYEHKCTHCHQMYSPQMNCILLAHQHSILYRIELLKKFWAPLLCWLPKQALTEATLLTSQKWKRNHYGRLDFDSSMRSCSTI